MIRPASIFLLPVLFATVCGAAEITVEPRQFTLEKTFAATVLPDNGCVLLQVEPKVWPDLEVIDLTPHGTKVSKGDILVRFDAETIDKKLTDTRSTLKSDALNLAQAELDLKTLQETSPNKLESLRVAAETAKEENTYFTETRRKANEDAAAQKLEHARQFLSNQQEELRQLTKMYRSKDLTEETEEIILTRQKEDVAAAEVTLRLETLDYKHTVEVSLPREAVSLSNNNRDAAITLSKAEKDIPRVIELKKIELENLRTASQRLKDTLADLEHDRTLFEIKAPADGWFYHGPIENGRWSPAEAVKTLFKHGRPPAGRPFATFVPASSKPVLVAFLDEATARALKAELAGTATLAGREEEEIPVKISRISSVPGPDGSYRADLSADWPKDLTLATGATAEARFIAYHQEAAITVPNNALTHSAAGWTVEVKLTDGKTENRTVKRGRITPVTTEILSGLEVGQVIVTH